MSRSAAFLLFAISAYAQPSVYLVLQKGASSLAWYTRQGKLLATAPTGLHPHEMVFSSDRKLVYTTDNGTMRIEQAGTGGNTISIFDIAKRRRVGTISTGQFRRPHGIDLDAKSGRLAVTTELPDQLLIIDPAKKAVLRTYDTKGKTSHMVSFGPGGRWAYVSNSNSSTVSAINLETGELKLIPTEARPEGSVLSRDGRELYVCNREAASLTVIDTEKNVAKARIATGKGPVRIALTPDGTRLVYALMHEKKVAWADPSTRRQLDYVLLPAEPVSLHLSKDGKLALVGAEQADRVYLVSLAERKIIAEIATEKGAGPDPVMEY
jgi:YVTN family beta-propeller protein